MGESFTAWRKSHNEHVVSIKSCSNQIAADYCSSERRILITLFWRGMIFLAEIRDHLQEKGYKN